MTHPKQLENVDDPYQRYQFFESPELLKLFLTYNCHDGLFHWVLRSEDMFSSNSRRGPAHTCSLWNARYGGRETYKNKNKSGYYSVTILGKYVPAHRAAWCLYYGWWPEEPIDHINGVKTDNRIVNLRCVSQTDNARNKRLNRNNTSGYPGVNWSKSKLKWEANIGVGGRRKFLGAYADIKDAIAAKVSAEKYFGYHENHGSTIPTQEGE